MKKLVTLSVLAATLASANENTYQIEIQGQFVAVEKATLDGLGHNDAGGMVDVAALSRLRAEGRARLLHSPRLLTPAGMEADVKSVEEVIYPTDFSVDLITNVVGKTAAVVSQSSHDYGRLRWTIEQARTRFRPAARHSRLRCNRRRVSRRAQPAPARLEPRQRDLGQSPDGPAV